MRSAYTVHSEFGYFRLSTNLRHKVRLALAFIVFGSIAGASGIIVQMASHEPTANGRSMIAAIPLNSSAKISTSISPASPAVSAPDQSNSVQAAPVDAMTTASIEPVATEASQQSATSQMPQKTARSQHPRDRDLNDAYARHQQRADYGRGRASGHDYSGAGW